MARLKLIVFVCDPTIQCLNESLNLKTKSRKNKKPHLFKAVDFDSDSAQKASDDSDSDSGINIGSQDDTDFLDAVQQLEDRRAVEIEAELHRHSEVLKMIQAKHYDQLEKLFIQKY